MEYKSTVRRNKLLMYTTTLVILKHIILSERNKDNKDSLLHDSVYRKF